MYDTPFCKRMVEEGSVALAFVACSITHCIHVFVDWWWPHSCSTDAERVATQCFKELSTKTGPEQSQPWSLWLALAFLLVREGWNRFGQFCQFSFTVVGPAAPLLPEPVHLAVQAAFSDEFEELDAEELATYVPRR